MIHHFTICLNQVLTNQSVIINIIQVAEFWRLLALCHTSMPEQRNGRLEYQAQSPDEAALTCAARNFGYVFKSRTAQTITLEVAGSEEVFF